MAKIVFLQRGWTEQIGVMCLSSVLKERGHKVDLFIEDAEKDIIFSAISSGADIIGFSVVTMMRPWMLEVAKKIKKLADIPIVVGGVDPTFYPEIINEDCIDIVCIGEGEEALLELLDSIDRGEIRTDIYNLWVKKNGKIYKNPLRPFISDLDRFPDPDREIYYKYNYFRKYPVKRVQAGRGCPYKCTYCFNHAYQKLYKGKGKYIRFRSVERVIQEIKNLQNKYGFRTLIFNDDILLLNRNWSFKFLEKYGKEIKKPFICSTTVNLLNEEIVKKLKEAGCYSVFFGIETGNEELRKNILKKNITNEQIFKATKLLRKYGIISRPTNLLGIPGESIENAFETLELNIKAKPDVSWCSIFVPYPGVELREVAIEEGLLDKDDRKEVVSYFSTTNLKHKDVNKFLNLQKLFSFTVKFPFLLPFIKKIISLPPNPLFNLIFLGSFTYVFSKSHNLTLLESIYWHARNIKKFL